MQTESFDETSRAERLKALLSASESSTLEFKSAKGGFPRNFWETYSAFANTQGGTVIFGVTDKKGRVESVDGLTKEQIDAYKKDFWSNVNNPQIISANILENDDIEEHEYDGKHLLVFNIPRAGRHQIPVHRTKDPRGNTFRRCNEGDHKCNEADVRRMKYDSDDVNTRDARILEDCNIDSIDAESLRQYRQLFASAKPSHPWLDLDDKQLLEKLGGCRNDRRKKREGLTVAGLLMFGKAGSIRATGCVPPDFPGRCEYLGEKPSGRQASRMRPDGACGANLFQFYKRVFPKLASLLPEPFKQGKGIRKYANKPRIALCEAFVNALAHGDYTAPVSLEIKCYKTRIVFSNPGTLLIPPSQYYKGGESVCRNPSLQKMFMMICVSEKTGSGADKIMSGWADVNPAYPCLIIEEQRPDRVVLELPLVNMLSAETVSDLKRIYGDGIEPLGKSELLALSMCRAEGEISQDRLRSVIGQPLAGITRLLTGLKESKHLRPARSGGRTRYVINEKFRECSNGDGANANGGNNASDGAIPPAPGENIPKSPSPKIIAGGE